MAISQWYLISQAQSSAGLTPADDPVGNPPVSPDSQTSSYLFLQDEIVPSILQLLQNHPFYFATKRITITATASTNGTPYYFILPLDFEQIVKTSLKSYLIRFCDDPAYIGLVLYPPDAFDIYGANVAQPTSSSSSSAAQLPYITIEYISNEITTDTDGNITNPFPNAFVTAIYTEMAFRLIPQYVSPLPENTQRLMQDAQNAFQKAVLIDSRNNYTPQDVTVWQPNPYGSWRGYF